MSPSFRHTGVRWVLSLGLALALGAGAGCGSRTYPVHGQIVYKGEKAPATGLEGYLITMESEEQTVGARGTVQADGTFRVGTFKADDGAVPGKHRVMIAPPMTRGADRPWSKSLLQARYCRLDTSGLEITVGPGVNEVTLEVERAQP